MNELCEINNNLYTRSEFSIKFSPSFIQVKLEKDILVYFYNHYFHEGKQSFKNKYPYI